MTLHDIEISTDSTRLDIDLVHRHLSDSYWAPARSRAIVELSIKNSLSFGAYAEIARLTDAIATGGHLTALLNALQERQGRREVQLAALASVLAAVPFHDVLADWRRLLPKSVADGRNLLRQVVAGPIKFTPIERRIGWRERSRPPGC